MKARITEPRGWWWFFGQDRTVMVNYTTGDALLMVATPIHFK